MRYASAQAFRAALEHRLLAQSEQTALSPERLRRRVLLERILARLVAAEPDQWVLKGGMALEVRLGDRARATKDVDLGLRDHVLESGDLHERLVEAMATDADDHFHITAERPITLGEDGADRLTWRFKLDARLADKPFGRLQLDVSSRPYELEMTDRIVLPGFLTFAGVAAPAVEVVDVHRHAAEKLHAMLRDFGDRENTRVRDLVDIIALIENRLLDAPLVAAAARQVWSERDDTDPPIRFPQLPDSWSGRYPRLVADYPVTADTFPVASALVARLWAEMFQKKKG